MPLYINGREAPDISGGAPGEANNGANVGAGTGLIFRDKLGVMLNFRSLIAGAGIILTPNADDIEITSLAGAVTPVLSWGNNSVSATTATRYLTPWYDDGLAQTTAIQFRVPRAGTLQNLRVRHNSPGGNGNDIVYTVRVEGVASALTVTLASDAADGSDLANTVAVAAGDRIDIEVTKAAGVGSSPGDVVATLEYAG